MFSPEFLFMLLNVGICFVVVHSVQDGFKKKSCKPRNVDFLGNTICHRHTAKP